MRYLVHIGFRFDVEICFSCGCPALRFLKGMALVVVYCILYLRTMIVYVYIDYVFMTRSSALWFASAMCLWVVVGQLMRTVACAWGYRDEYRTRLR